MRSLHAQCLLTHSLEPRAAMPVHWRHGDDGSLSWHFGDSSATATRDADGVAEASERWLALDEPPPVAIATFVDAHVTVLDVLEQAGELPPDAVCHDLLLREVRAYWHAAKRVVIVDHIGDRPVGVLG